MYIPVDCSCGYSFMARKEYGGGPTKCPSCKSVVQVPGAGKTRSQSTPNAATSQSSGSPVAAGPGSGQVIAEPWYYAFVQNVACFGMVAGVLQFLLALVLASQERGIMSNLTAVIYSGLICLFSVYGFAVALLLLDIGRNVRISRR